MDCRLVADRDTEVCRSTVPGDRFDLRSRCMKIWYVGVRQVTDVGLGSKDAHCYAPCIHHYENASQRAVVGSLRRRYSCGLMCRIRFLLGQAASSQTNMWLLLHEESHPLDLGRQLSQNHGTPQDKKARSTMY